MMISESSRAKRLHGFTLVEVLVALAVVSLVLVALLGSMQAVVASATMINDRILASWIASDRVTEIRLGTEYPEVGTSSGETTMADLEWFYDVAIVATESDDIRQIIVKVATVAEPEAFLAVASGSVVRPGPQGGGRLNGTSTTVSVPGLTSGGSNNNEQAPEATEGETE